MVRIRLKKFVASGLILLTLSAASAACSDDGGDKKTSTTKTTTPSERQVELGIRAQTQGNLDQALSRYEKAAELDPTNKFAFYNIGTVYQARNDVTNASNAYEKALTIDQNYKPALYNLAILREPFAPESSEELYNRILALSPNDANVLLKLGLLQRQIGKDDEATANLSKAVSIDPSLQSQINGGAPATDTTSTTRR